MAVVDREWATVGSSNIDPFSLMLAKEANIVALDGKIAAELRDSLETAMQNRARERRHNAGNNYPGIPGCCAGAAMASFGSPSASGYGNRH